MDLFVIGTIHKVFNGHNGDSSVRFVNDYDIVICIFKHDSYQ